LPIRTQIGAYSADTNNFDRHMNQLMADIGMHESDIADQEQIIRKTDEAINQIPDEEIRKLKERLTSATGRKEQAIADIARATVRRDEQKVELSKLNNKQDVLKAIELEETIGKI
jgi:cob(I)alamin adenosyltransferase